MVSFSFLPFTVFCLCVSLPSCGLLDLEPDLPSRAEVRAARQAEAPAWERLGYVTRIYQDEGAAALPTLRDVAAQYPQDLRLQVLLQDIEQEIEGPEAVAARYAQRWEDSVTAQNAFLAARVAPDRQQAEAWVAQALEMDPDLVMAQVYQLGLEARVGDDSVLDPLIRILLENPGSAEGWRLLQRLADLFGRSDLELRALQTEPWSPLEGPRRGLLARAAAAQQADASEQADRLLQELPEDDREAVLIRAAALTEAGRYQEAHDILWARQQDNPDDVQVIFNLGLLALDYLGDAELAQQQLQIFLEKVEQGAEVPIQREVQARLWLERLELSGLVDASQN